MCDGKKRAAPDFYDWIVSREIRDCLRENHRFSFEEKIQLICGACRPLEGREVYRAPEPVPFQELLEEVQKEEL